VVTVARAITTVAGALMVGYGFRGGMTWRLLGCLAAATIIDATVSFLETISSRNA